MAGIAFTNSGLPAGPLFRNTPQDVFKQPCLEIRVKSTPVIGNTHRWNRLELTRASQSLFKRIVVNVPVRFGQGWKMDNKRLGKALDIMRLAEEAAARPGGISLVQIVDTFGVTLRTAQRMSRALEEAFEHSV